MLRSHACTEKPFVEEGRGLEFFHRDGYMVDARDLRHDFAPMCGGLMPT